MKIVATILLIIISSCTAYGQEERLQSYSKVDTLQQLESGILAHVKTYQQGQLTEEMTAYLYPDTLTVPRFRLLRNLLTTTVYVDRIIRHGETKEYSPDGKVAVSVYANGNIKSRTYYNESGEEISGKEYWGNRIVIGPCGEIIEEYLIHGEKEE